VLLLSNGYVSGHDGVSYEQKDQYYRNKKKKIRR